MTEVYLSSSNQPKPPISKPTLYFLMCDTMKIHDFFFEALESQVSSQFCLVFEWYP